MHPQISSRYLQIDPALCQLCTRCLVQRNCRRMAVVRFDRDESPVIDPARCQRCLACFDYCPQGAISWVESI